MTGLTCISNFVSSPTTVNPLENPVYCSCQSEYCDCGSVLGITEAAALKVYAHLGFPEGRERLLANGFRESALHIWGTHHLSTDDLLSWLADYNPTRIEWINDASCNVIFADANTVLRIIVDFAEPFDRRVALAAAAALATLLEAKDNAVGLSDDQLETMNISEPDGTLHVSTETLDSIEDFSQYLPPTGRWYKALSVPTKAVSLFLRFAHTSDVKQPGSERRSLYYRRYGNPNYGGVTGILSRSYKRRLRLGRPNTDDDTDGNHNLRVFPAEFAEFIADAYEDPDAIGSPPPVATSLSNNNNTSTAAPARELIVYDNLYNTVKPSKNTTTRALRVGGRRDATGFPLPTSRRQPQKWPRKNSGPPPDRWLMACDDDDVFSPPLLENINVIDLREPWSTLPPSEPYIFRGAGERRVLQRCSDGTTTVTLMPDPEPRVLPSMSMVADREECVTKKRSLAERLGSSHVAQTSRDKSSWSRSRSRNVWQRLG